MVTVEVAVALPILVLVTALGIWGVTAASIKLTCLDAARSGARAAARGESMHSVRALVTESLPAGALVRVHRDLASSQVDVAVPVDAPVAAKLPPLIIRVHATAITEPGAATADHGADGAPMPRPAPRTLIGTGHRSSLAPR
jgi:hypothetical protein